MSNRFELRNFDKPRRKRYEKINAGRNNNVADHFEDNLKFSTRKTEHFIFIQRHLNTQLFNLTITEIKWL